MLTHKAVLQTTEQETQGLRSRLEATEQRQQQMMNFLTKAVQNPVFLQQLLNQRQAQRISGPDKSKLAVAAECVLLACFVLRAAAKCTAQGMHYVYPSLSSYLLTHEGSQVTFNYAANFLEYCLHGFTGGGVIGRIVTGLS